jgi:hypothetical protein
MLALGAGRVLIGTYRDVLAGKTSFDARWLMVIDRLDRVREAFAANRNSVEAVAAAIAAVPGDPGAPGEGRLS